MDGSLYGEFKDFVNRLLSTLRYPATNQIELS